MKDLYNILEIPRFSNAEEVKSSYRKLAKVWHPDVNEDPAAEAKFREIQEAYEILMDPGRKATYDLIIHAKRKKRNPSSSQQKQTPPPQPQKSSFEIWLEQERDKVYESYYGSNIEAEKKWEFDIKIVKNNPWHIYAAFMIGLWAVTFLSTSDFGIILFPILSAGSFLIGCKKD